MNSHTSMTPGCNALDKQRRVDTDYSHTSSLHTVHTRVRTLVRYVAYWYGHSSHLVQSSLSFDYCNTLATTAWMSQRHSVHCPLSSPHPAHASVTSSQSPSSLSPSTTPSIFHSRLKTHLFDKSFPLQSFWFCFSFFFYTVIELVT